MALDISSTQSLSLLDDEKSRPLQGGAPPITAQKQKVSTALHMVHPGAVLCMIDLLPAVDVEQTHGRTGDDNSNSDVLSSQGKPSLESQAKDTSTTR